MTLKVYDNASGLMGEQDGLVECFCLQPYSKPNSNGVNIAKLGIGNGCKGVKKLQIRYT